MPNYANGKIYKITNDYNDDVYIGSTCECLNKRFHKHRYDSKSDKYKNSKIYKLMNEIGVNRFRIDLIENYPCNDKISLVQREGHFIRELGTLNINIAGRTKDEWVVDNAEKVKEQNSEYRQINKDKINEKDRIYYQQNKDKIKQYQIENRKQNKEKIKEYKREYHERNKEEINRKQREYRQRKKLEKLEKENLAI